MDTLTFLKRSVVILYAGLAYATFLAAVLWAVGFLAGLHLPSVADGAARQSVWLAALIDIALLLLFAGQHTAMARAWFKQHLARVLPTAAERSTFVLAASLLLIAVFWLWQPLPGKVWQLREQPWAGLVWALYAAGWLVTVSATFMVDHFDFAGLRQAWLHGRQGRYRPPAFTARWLYAWVRHPMMLGLLIVFWATPRMTAGHLLFAGAGTAYIGVGIRFEERDLRRELGDDYRDYAARVPALIPMPGRAGLRQRASRSA